VKDLFTDTEDGYLRSGIVRFHEALRPLLVPIDSVQQHPDNDNNGDEDAVQESILINGMYQAIKVQDSTGYICAGNTTWAVCKNLGAECIPIVRKLVDDIQALRIMVADNKTARLARADDALTAAALDKIREHDGNVEGTGFTMEELERMEAEQQVPLDLDVDPYEGWPTLSAQLSPSTFRAFMDLTEDAEDDGNRGRVEYLMNLAGWRK
jgi:hypothetical protein